VDDEGNPRLVAKAPDLDDLLRLGFEQVRISAETHPLILERMVVLLDLIEKAAARAAVDSPETGRQRRLIEEMGKV
jgi:uncharacterized membrane protein